MGDQIEQKQTKGTKMKKHRLFFVAFVCFCSLMHPLYPKAGNLSYEVIGAAIEVHRLKGPGLIESIYEKCVARELSLRNIAAVTQRVIQIEYKGLVFDEPLRFDMLVDDCLLLELKAV